jgi:lysozyme family protein
MRDINQFAAALWTKLQIPGVPMQTVRQIAEEIVAREGGFVNDPDDPGGATKFGVTIGTMRRLGLDLTGDGGVDVADVRALGREQAVNIFITHYFRRPRISEMPSALQPSLFDMYVNAGGNAVKILQRLLGDMGYKVGVDGTIGPQTLGAAKKAAVPDGVALRDAYGVARRNYYFRLADRRVASRKYARTRGGGKGGWIKRAEVFLSPRYRLTSAQFQRRVAAWG